MDVNTILDNHNNLKVGQRVEIHSYKHNGKIHRVWKYASIVEVTDNCLVVVNDKTRVIESNGRVWYTKEPAVCYFFKNSWFNIISMIRSNGIHFYCNIATPFIWDGEAIKYIDYDLDLKVFPNGKLKVLDEKEFALHSKIMKYPDKLKMILNNELARLQDVAQSNNKYFDSKNVYNYYDTFQKLSFEKKKL